MNSKNQDISICIPTYKNAVSLRKLLDSIKMQSFKDFNVIVSDDSPDNSVAAVCEEYQEFYEIIFYKNEQSLGSPENWNNCISKADSKYIKIMHHDDYFLKETALQEMHNEMEKGNSEAGFCWCTDIYENKKVEHRISRAQFDGIAKTPEKIFSGNVIGAPSVMIIRNDVNQVFDRKMKWLVDIDYYFRLFNNYEAILIESNNIAISISSEQITNDCVDNIDVDFKEWLYLYKKNHRLNLLKNRYLLKSIVKKIYYYRNNPKLTEMIKAHASFFEIYLLFLFMKLYCFIRGK